MEVEKPFYGIKQACLPSPSFDDVRMKKKDSIHAWFGLQLRYDHACQTNRFGMMKFHFCDKREGKGRKACNTETPPPEDKECEIFFKKPYTPNNVPRNVEEIRILSHDGKHSKYCYPKKNPEKGGKGWCNTVGNYYNFRNVNETHQGWGFCSKGCFLKSSHKNMLNIKKNVNLLEEKMCADLMSFGLPESVKINLRVLCVAPVKNFKESVWVKIGDEYERAEVSQKAKRFGVATYLASPETCESKSGGPLFVKDKDRYVITGRFIFKLFRF